MTVTSVLGSFPWTLRTFDQITWLSSIQATPFRASLIPFPRLSQSGRTTWARRPVKASSLRFGLHEAGMGITQVIASVQGSFVGFAPAAMAHFATSSLNFATFGSVKYRLPFCLALCQGTGGPGTVKWRIRRGERYRIRHRADTAHRPRAFRTWISRQCSTRDEWG